MLRPPRDIRAGDAMGSRLSKNESREDWDIYQSIARVRASFEESNTGEWSKAVRVNGQCSNLSNIPKELKEVVFGGSKTRLEPNHQEWCYRQSMVSWFRSAKQLARRTLSDTIGTIRASNNGISNSLLFIPWLASFIQEFSLKLLLYVYLYSFGRVAF